MLFRSFWDSSEYKSSNGLLASTLRGLAVYSKALSSQLMNSSISSVGSSGCPPSGGRRESPSARLFLFPGTCLTLKSHSWIYASHLVIKAPGKSVAARFSCATKVFASVSTINRTPYRYTRHFFSVCSNARHLSFPKSYFYSARDQMPLSYRHG